MAAHQSISRVLKAVAQGRFIYFLGFLLLLMLVFPFLEELAYGPPVMQLLYSFMLVSALYAVSQTRWVFRTGILLLVTGLATHWWIIMTMSPVAVVAGVVCGIAFFGFVAAGILRHVFGHEQVTGDTIAGAVCVFIMIGLIWTVAYQGIRFFDHNALSNVAARSFSGAAMVDVVYYSFCTLTTLGYGDIAPVSKAARMFAVTEAIVGQIYLTVLIARLVGLYAPVRSR